ncbi:MAG: NAD-dependent dehydratase [Devosia sp.]|nr:NAD-dependent dehydratase [Devosia sp.]
MAQNTPNTVVISGGGGNIGGKLIAYLVERDWCKAIIALDVREPSGAPFDHPKVSVVVCDLTDPTDKRWHDAVAKADAIVHLAATNAAPDSSWAEATGSLDQTFGLLDHASKLERCRFVFASSNHAMGGWKDADIPAPGRIGMMTPPMPGTRLFDGTGHKVFAPYAATKLIGERACIAMAHATEGRVTAVGLRIGWIQRGVNHPSTIFAGGGAQAKGEPVVNPQEEKDLTWFRNMWLSDGDMGRVFEAALIADASQWPGPAVVVPAVSNNTGTLWDLDEGRKWLGYEPQDDAWAELAR